MKIVTIRKNRRITKRNRHVQNVTRPNHQQSVTIDHVHVHDLDPEQDQNRDHIVVDRVIVHRHEIHHHDIVKRILRVEAVQTWQMFMFR